MGIDQLVELLVRRLSPGDVDEALRWLGRKPAGMDMFGGGDLRIALQRRASEDETTRTRWRVLDGR